MSSLAHSTLTRGEKMEHNIHAQVNLIADDLKRTARLLEKGNRSYHTKAELQNIIATAYQTVQADSDTLMKPHSALDPVVAGDKNNSLCDELQKIVEDIGTVQYLIAKNDIKAADELLAEIKKRI